MSREQLRVRLAGAVLGVLYAGLLLIDLRLGAALIGAAVIGWACLVRPAWSVVLLIGALCFDQVDTGGGSIGGLPITLTKLATLGGLGLYTVHAIARRKRMIRWTPASSGLAATTLVALFTLFYAEYFRIAAIPVASLVMLFVLTHFVERAVEVRDLPMVYRGGSALVLMVILWTLAQRQASALSGGMNAWSERTSAGFGDANIWACFLVIICPMLIGGLAKDTTRLGKALLVGLIIFFPLAVFQSFSRGGFLALVATAPWLWVLLKDYRKYLPAALVVAAVALVQVVDLDGLSLRYATLANPTMEGDMGHGSLAERTALLMTGIEMIGNHPIFGVGVGMFRFEAAHMTSGIVHKISHNSYISILAELGVLGLLAYGLLVWQTGAATWRAWRRTDDPAVRAQILGFGASMTAMAAMMMTLNLETFAPFFVLLGLGLVVIHAAERADAGHGHAGLRGERASGARS